MPFFCFGDLFSLDFNDTKTMVFVMISLPSPSGESSKVDLSVLDYYFVSLAAFFSWYTEQPQ